MARQEGDLLGGDPQPRAPARAGRLRGRSGRRDLYRTAALGVEHQHRIPGPRHGRLHHALDLGQRTRSKAANALKGDQQGLLFRRIHIFTRVN